MGPPGARLALAAALALANPAVAGRALRNATQLLPEQLPPLPGDGNATLQPAEQLPPPPGDGRSAAQRPPSSGAEGVAGSLKLANVLAEAVALMEQGTERLVNGPNASQESAEPLRKILHELKGMHLIVGQLRGRYMTDMVSLQAEVDRQRAGAEAARRESEMLREDKARFQQGVQGAEQVKCDTELQRKTWGFMMELRDMRHNLTQECALARKKDSAQLENLTQQARSCQGDMDKLYFEVERTKADLRDRDDTVADLQKRLHDLEDERNLLVLERQSLQQNASATRREWEQDKLFETKVLSEWRDKAEDLQEELGDRTEQARGLLAKNTNLKKDIESSKQTVASLQRDLADMSDDKAALLDSMRAFIHGNSAPAARALAAANASGQLPVEAPARGQRTVEVSMKKTEQIDHYLHQLHTSPPTTTTLPHLEAPALTKVFGAQAPAIIKVLGPPEPTPKPKEALQKFLNISGMPEGAVREHAVAATPPQPRQNASRSDSDVAPASASVAGGDGAGHAKAKHRPLGLQRSHAGANATANATAQPAQPAQLPSSLSAAARLDTVPAAASAAAVARAEAAVSAQLNDAEAAEADDQQWHAEAAARTRSAEAMRDSFGEADRLLGGAEPLPEEAAPAVPPLHVTDASVAAAGATAMQDLFSEADRIIFSAVGS